MNRVLVTGGAVRLGAQICRTLAQKGWDVVVHYRSSQQEAESLVKELCTYGVEAESLHGDLGTVEGVRAFLNAYLARFKETYGLVNNIGSYAIASALNTSAEQMQELFQTNLQVPLMLVQGLLPALKEQKGRVVNLGMTGAQLVAANTYATAYNMVKLALTMLTKSLAKECLGSQVTVNMVSPGYLENAVDLPPSLPMGRPAQCEEVARVVGFLMERENGYITGQNIEIAGGVRL